MSLPLNIPEFPLHGSRLIEASAGTGKTYTIALLYTRLILQHGGIHSFERALTPEEILVVTFTDAATQELKDRIRVRLSEAARCFLAPGDDCSADHDLLKLREDFQAELWPHCARLLSLAAQSMDQSAVSTIHGWCYRMLREHAFDSGSLFNQELVTNQRDVLAELIRDYWRQHFYALDVHCANALQQQFSDPDALLKCVQPLINKTSTRLSYAGQDVPCGDDLAQTLQPFAASRAALHELESEARACWSQHQDELETLLDSMRPALMLNSYSEAKSDDGFATLKQCLRDWAQGGERPVRFERFAAGAWKLKKVDKQLPDQPQHLALEKISQLLLREGELATSRQPDLRACVLAHARHWLERALEQRLQEKAELGFDDLLLQLDRALHGAQGDQLARRIRADFPVAMIDEFQDTDPLQYRIFDRIYQIAKRGEATDSAVILIGDPKQAIYSFRNADIHTYLQARRATAGRHYNLSTNYRSTRAAVAVVNYLFAQAEQYPTGAFRFKSDADDPLPFLAVEAKGREESLVIDGEAAPALSIWHAVDAADAEAAISMGRYRELMATRCAAEIAQLLSSAQTGFQFKTQGLHDWRALAPRDIAILVRSRQEAELVRAALQRLALPSVFLSDRESVFGSREAADLLFWLSACAEPGDERRLRAALATVSLDLPLSDLQRMLDDEFHWEAQTALFRQLHQIWRTQGVLPMLRTLMQHYQLPQRLISQDGGERRLTNLLHLAEYLQKASQQHEGEQALIRHLAEQIAEPGDEEILRLESDDDLIRVVTIHKSKGLEYPLVFLPFAAAYRPVDHKQAQVMITDAEDPVRSRLEIAGPRQDDAAWAQADNDRLAEDIRLLYVALTRARHAIWLGVGSVCVGNSKSASLHRSALGYLMAGSESLSPAQTTQVLLRWQAECALIHYESVSEDALNNAGVSNGADHAQPLTTTWRPARQSIRSPAENWWIASYSALKIGSHTGAAELPQDEQTVEELLLSRSDALLPERRIFSRLNPGLHGFHRGPDAGTFLHSLLEWACKQGFSTAAYDHEKRRQYVRTACELRGWPEDAERLDSWLGKFLQNGFGPDVLKLCELDTCQAEMEFLFAANQVNVSALDRLCHDWLLPGQRRPALQPSMLNGMMKGFIDLVFMHQGKYFVADWKSNYLGPTDAHYTEEAIAAEVLDSRYDVQYAIYLLALHRLLRNRLGNYDYDQQLGGAVYFFLRGWKSTTGGLLIDKPPAEFIDALDRLFQAGRQQVHHA